MKKLLSFVIVALMMVSSIIPVFAVSEAPDGPDEPNAMNIWIKDVKLDVDVSDTVDVTVNLSNNVYGFTSMKVIMVYPPCLEKQSIKRGGRVLNPGELQEGDEKDATTIDKVLSDFFGDLGLDAETILAGGKKCSGPLIDCISHFDPDADEDILVDNTSNGVLVTYKFKYDASKNPEGLTELPLEIYATALHCEGPGAGPYAGQSTTVIPTNGKITLLNVPTPGCAHDGETENVNVVDATCTTAGSYDVKCLICNEIIDHVEVLALGHDMTATPAAAASCTEEGNIAYWYCSRCEKYFSDAEGNTEITLADTVIGKIAHTPGEPVRENVVNGSCTVDGSYDEVVYCTECGTEISRETKTIKAPGHTPGEPVVENRVEPTCVDSGSYDEVVYCTVCNQEISREHKTIDPTGIHTPGEVVIENRTASSCTEAGSYDEVVYCTVCNAELSREKKYTQVGEHTPGQAVVENRVEPTCTANGSYDEVVYCTVCEQELSRETKTILALGHDMTATPAVPASCTEEGNIAYWYCSRCEKYFSDAEGNTEITLADTVIDKIAHTPGTPVRENEVPESCTVDGSYDEVVYCTVCEQELSREHKTIKAPGHTPGEPVVENRVEPTCVDPGFYDEVVYCTVCNQEISREYKTIDPTGIHTPGAAVEENRHEPTCALAGSYDEVVYCTVCNHEISRETKTINPTGIHTPGEPVRENVVNGSCTVDGSYDEVVYCMVCEQELSRETKTIKAPGHKYEEVERQPASCKEEGYVKYRCTECNDEYTDTLLKVPHTPAATWTLVEEATAEKDGLEVLLCTVCGAELESRVVSYKVLDVKIVPSARLVSAAIDNRARTIDVVVKNGQVKGVYNLVLPKGATVTLTDEAFASGNEMQIKNVRYNAATDAAGIRYIISYVENGFVQTYTLKITDADGDEFIYTVNVRFEHAPAISGIEAGYRANAAESGISADDDHVINVVSKEGATDVAFRLLLAKGATVRVISEEKPHIIQTPDKGATYEEVAEINDNAFAYFKTVKAEELREFDLRVTYSNGEYEDFHVVVTFVD